MPDIIFNTNSRFADWACILRLEPGTHTVFMESMKTHKHHVLIAHFIITLTNRAKLIIFWKINFVRFSEFVQWKSFEHLLGHWGFFFFVDIQIFLVVVTVIRFIFFIRYLQMISRLVSKQTTKEIQKSYMMRLSHFTLIFLVWLSEVIFFITTIFLPLRKIISLKKLHCRPSLYHNWLIKDIVLNASILVFFIFSRFVIYWTVEI